MLLLLNFWDYNLFHNGQIIPLLAPKHTSKHKPWGLNGTKYWRLFIAEYPQPSKFKEKPGFNPIYQVSCFSLLGDVSRFHVFPGKGRFSLSAQWKKMMFLGKKYHLSRWYKKYHVSPRPFLERHHLFRRCEENIIFPCIFLRKIIFNFPSRM